MTTFTSKYRTAFIFLLACIWTRKTLFAYGIVMLRKIPVIGYEIYTYVIPFFLIIVALIAFQHIKKKIKIFDYLFYIIFSLVYLFSYFLNTRNTEFLSTNAIEILFHVVIVYFVGLCIDKNEYIDILHKLSVLSIIAFLIYKAMNGYNLTNSSYMSEAFTTLPHICMIFYYALKKHNIVDIMLSVIGFFLLLSFGTRGAILELFLFILCYILFFGEYKKKGLIIGLLVTLSILFFITFNFWIEILSKIILSIGLSNRIIYMIAQGNLTSNNGRNILHEVIINEIRSHPFIGEGIGADRVYIGSYSHNLLYELWISYGVPIGTILIAVVVFIFVRALAVREESNIKGFKFLLVMVAFIKLFMSSSYLQEPFFFLLLGVCVTSIRNQRKQVVYLEHYQ